MHFLFFKERMKGSSSLPAHVSLCDGDHFLPCYLSASGETGLEGCVGGGSSLCYLKSPDSRSAMCPIHTDTHTHTRLIRMGLYRAHTHIGKLKSHTLDPVLSHREVVSESSWGRARAEESKVTKASLLPIEFSSGHVV